jgi:methylamine dehydrogenase heavy chain
MIFNFRSSHLRAVLQVLLCVAALPVAAIPGTVLAADAPPEESKGPPPPSQPVTPRPAPLKAEVSDVATLGPTTPHRLFSMSWGGSVVIFDGDKGKIEGQLPAAHDGMIALAPDYSRFYVSETMWTHGNRGTRLDLLSIYDSKTLNLVKEIELPGRAVVGYKMRNLDVNASGTRAYVYSMRPAASIVWVNLTNQTLGGTIEIPGCALVFPWGEDGVSSLCGDGSMAIVSAPTGEAPKITHTKPFFDAANDPIFDNSLIDKASNRAVFLTYTGLIYTATLGADPIIDKPWSIQESAGFKRPGTAANELAWRPGGIQPIGWHKDSDRLYVLMHAGDYWTHHNAATEVWVLNLKTHALLMRYPINAKPDANVRSIVVSQKAKPLMYLLSENDGHIVLDADTGEELRKIDFAHGEAALVPGL